MPTRTVLIAEDDQDIREMLADLLSDEGYTVFEAPNGQSALDRIRAHPERLVVLLDMRMPDMNGPAVLQAVAAEAPLATRHAYLLMTAHRKTLPEKIDRLLTQLNVARINKPFDIYQLLEAVRQAASKLQ